MVVTKSIVRGRSRGTINSGDDRFIAWSIVFYSTRSPVFNILIILIAYLLVIAMLAIGVVGPYPGAIRPMFRAPKQFIRLLISRRLRQNHALEHATINVIEQRYRTRGVIGMPDMNGFHLRGRISPDTVISATHEAFRRLKRGEVDLAWNRRCPTSLVGTQMLLTVVLLIVVMAIWREFTAPPLLIALLAGALLGPPISPFLQRWLLVDPDPESLQFRDVEVRQPTGRLAMLSFFVYSPLFVRTAVVPQGRGKGGEVTLITSDQEEIEAGSYRLRD